MGRSGLSYRTAEEDERGEEPVDGAFVHLADADVNLAGVAGDAPADGDRLGPVIGPGLLDNRGRGGAQFSEQNAESVDGGWIIVKHVAQSRCPGACLFVEQPLAIRGAAAREFVVRRFHAPFKTGQSREAALYLLP